jgi:hypothetical protein
MRIEKEFMVMRNRETEGETRIAAVKALRRHYVDQNQRPQSIMVTSTEPGSTFAGSTTTIVHMSVIFHDEQLGLA